MIRVYNIATSRKGTLRKLLAGFAVGVVLTLSVAVYLHETRACMTDEKIAEYVRGVE